MLGGKVLWPAPPEKTTRIAVTVTFLRQETPPAPAPVVWPDGVRLERVARPDVPLYRYLYNTVGAPWVWWLRRTMADEELAHLLGAPGVSLHVLYRGETILGFYELDARPVVSVNIAYFGLMPEAIGQGLGMMLLSAAVAGAWAHRPRAVTVNTCTADHPRALPNYLSVGFAVVRTAREIWDVPDRLGLVIPEALKL